MQINIKPTKTHKFLGVLVDKALCWYEHVNYTIGKGTAYVIQLFRLSNSTTGLPLKLMHQLYTVVALPKMLYTIDICCLLMYISNNDTHQKGSIQVITTQLHAAHCLPLHHGNPKIDSFKHTRNPCQTDASVTAHTEPLPQSHPMHSSNTTHPPSLSQIQMHVEMLHPPSLLLTPSPGTCI